VTGVRQTRPSGPAAVYLENTYTTSGGADAVKINLAPTGSTAMVYLSVRVVVKKGC
jgi:hypothetical protein